MNSGRVIRAAHEKTRRTYGAKRLHKEWQDEGFVTGHDRVQLQKPKRKLLAVETMSQTSKPSACSFALATLCPSAAAFPSHWIPSAWFFSTPIPLM